MIHVTPLSSGTPEGSVKCSYIFPVSLLVVETYIDLVCTETEGVATNTKTERVGGTQCRNTEAHMQNKDILLHTGVDPVLADTRRLTNVNF